MYSLNSGDRWMVTAKPPMGMRNVLPLKMSDTKPRPSLIGCDTSPVGSMLNAPPKLKERRSCNPLRKSLFTFSKHVALLAHSQLNLDSSQSLLSLSLAAAKLITTATSNTTRFTHIFLVSDIIYVIFCVTIFLALFRTTLSTKKKNYWTTNLFYSNSIHNIQFILCSIATVFSVLFFFVFENMPETKIWNNKCSRTSARHLIVYWSSDKAKIMLILENLRFLLFSHFMILPPIWLHRRFSACASRTNKSNCAQRKEVKRDEKKKIRKTY